MDAATPLSMRGWPRSPEAVLNPTVTIRIAMRMMPGTASLESLQACGHFSAEDAGTLVNAGAMLGFVRSKSPPTNTRTASEPTRLKARPGAWLDMRQIGVSHLARAS